jgi:hypothetical protein
MTSLLSDLKTEDVKTASTKNSSAPPEQKKVMTGVVDPFFYITCSRF